MAASTGLLQNADHTYWKSITEKKESRVSSFFLTDHVYSKEQGITPKKGRGKRERGLSTPTGKTPVQPTKKFSSFENKPRQHIPWTSEEKDFVISYAAQTPRGTETVNDYWQKCADQINVKFPGSNRKGLSCKSLAQRLFVSPQCSQPVTVSSRTADVGTQTEDQIRTDDQEADWVFMQPIKDIQESASMSAHAVHETVMKRLRKYPPLTNTEKNCLVDIIKTGTLNQIARAALGVGSLGEEIKNIFLFDTEMEAKECSNKGSSLYLKNYEHLVNFQWGRVINELMQKQTFLAEVLLAVALPKDRIGNTVATEALVPVLGMVYGALMKQRYYALNGVQKMITTALANEQIHQKVYDRLQPLGITLSHQGLLDTMTSISGSFNSKLIDSLKRGKRFRVVGDNINFQMGVAQFRLSEGKVSHMEHWFGSAAVVQNISFPDLNNDGPQYDLRQLPTEMFILNEEDWQNITYNFSIHCSRVLVDFFPWLKIATSAVSQPLADVPDAMKIKNEIIPLPVMHKNEQKYADVVDILASYQEICENTYKAAGKDIDKVHIGGDQLTRERFSGAKKLRAAALTETERFEALSPITFELFHLQMAVLTLFYQILYDEHHTDIFTLHSQRIRLLRKDANGQDVKNHYDSCKELGISVIRAYLVQAACEKFEMPNLQFQPDFVPELDTMTDEQKKEWLISKVSPIIYQVTSTSRNVIDGTLVEDASPDIIYNYSNILLELGLVFLELCDNVKNPNRKRFITCMKYLMIVMKGHNNKSKYALEILRLLCQQFALLSERAASEAVYGLFVNTGKTIIPVDQQMEHLVKLTKGHLHAMCSNVTDASLVKRSSTFFGMNAISEVFDKETSVLSRAQKHKHISSKDDETRIVCDLNSIKPFTKGQVDKPCSSENNQGIPSPS